MKLHQIRTVFFFLINRLRYGRLEFGAVIKKPIKITGKRNIFLGKVFVLNGARIEAVTKYEGVSFNPKIEIQDNVMINQNLHMTCAESIIIGKGTSITANVGIFDIDHPYENIDINPRTQPIKTKPVLIGSNCLIGMNSVILPGTKIGDHVIVGTCTVVSGTIPDYCVVVGIPGKIIKRYNFEEKDWMPTHPDGTFK